MAGHSKWANIKHRKAAQDAKRGKIFTRFIREITVAARQGGGDADANPRLRAAIDKALSGNMTRDTIERAIKRGTGDLEGVEYEDILFEGYAPSGVAVMVETSTDNRNRTVSEVRHAFSKFGGNLGTDGSVAYQFNRQGVILFSPENNEETIMEAAIESGADDVVVEDDGSIEVITQAEDFHKVVTALYETGLNPEESEIGYKATMEVELDNDGAEKVLKLLDALEELDDVQNVHSNAVFPDDFEG